MPILPFSRPKPAAESRAPESRLAALTRRVGVVQEVRDYATTPWSRAYFTLLEWELKQRLVEAAYEMRADSFREARAA